jgi:hypothetical protein
MLPADVASKTMSMPASDNQDHMHTFTAKACEFLGNVRNRREAAGHLFCRVIENVRTNTYFSDKRVYRDLADRRPHFPGEGRELTKLKVGG